MLALVGLCAVSVVRSWRGEFVPLIRIGMLILFGTLLLSAIKPLLAYFSLLIGKSGVGEKGTLLLKALGVSLLSEYASGICRECGEESAASSIELFGKLELLILCIPLIEELLGIAEELFSMGGAL